MRIGPLFFNDDEKDIIKDIAKIYSVEVSIVEKHYADFIKAVKDEAKN